VIGGDSDRPSGPFESSLAALETGLFQRHGIVHIVWRATPKATQGRGFRARDALAEKKSLARRTGLDLQVVTQFCFEAEPVLVWAAKMKGHGLPVRVGLPVRRACPAAAICGALRNRELGRALKARPQAITRLLIEAGRKQWRGTLHAEVVRRSRASISSALAD